MEIRVTVTLDPGALTALNGPDGVVGRATLRAGDRTAERMRQNILSADLVDTGEMVGTTRAELTGYDILSTTVEAGSAAEHAVFHQRPFRDALAQLSPDDFDGR